MTRLLEGDTLRQMAQVISVIDPPPARMVPVMAWRIDEISRRPVCAWRLEPKAAVQN